jgi:two-component system chemotaxis response regulator CheB
MLNPESLTGLNLPFEGLGFSIYSHPRVAALKKPAPIEIKTNLTAPISVLCIDDSDVILKILDKVIGSDPNFKVAKCVKSGLEAQAFLKTQHVDVVTLDLHMPQMDGIEYLRKFFGPHHPPVVVVSSVSREDESSAKMALSLGAYDYVEKPSMANLVERGNEIRSKLKLALKSKKAVVSPTRGSEKQISKSGSSKKVLIVDDSKAVREVIKKIVSAEPNLSLCGELESAKDLESFIRTTRPDVITLDVNMPGIDGLTALRTIIAKFKVPTVMISGLNPTEGNMVFQALEAGAIDFIEKPSLRDLQERQGEFAQRILAAASSRWIDSSTQSVRRITSSKKAFDSDYVVIGASTGGTEAIRAVLEALPENIPPILIVQHIPPVFSKSFADRLNSLCPFEVKEAKNGDWLVPNQVLIAPGGQQMGLEMISGKLRVVVREDAPVNRHRPSVDYLFFSAGHTQIPKVAILLTGMGVDGAVGLKRLKELGSFTIVQDESTSVVFGMPKEAIRIGAAGITLPIDKIGAQTIEILTSKKAS